MFECTIGSEKFRVNGDEQTLRKLMMDYTKQELAKGVKLSNIVFSYTPTPVAHSINTLRSWIMDK